MRSWSRAARAATGTAAWAGCVGLAVAGGVYLGDIFTQPDAETYLKMAAGERVMLPFAWRQLGPMLAAATSHAFGISLQQSFMVQGLLALAVLAGVVTLLLVRSGAPGWMLPAVLALLFWTIQFNVLAFPDVLYAAVLAVLLWLLSEGYVLAATWMLYPLALTRESTLLVLVCLLVAGWGRLRAWQAISAMAATAAGMLTVRWLARAALPNHEGLSPALYMVAKLPWNLLRNVLGLQAWADVYPACAAPVWTHALPLGPLHTVGVCGFSLGSPRDALGMALASFGLLPLLWWWLRRDLRREPGLLLRFATLYGGASFLLSPLLGMSSQRLFAYGWPLFLVAMPLLLGSQRAGFTSRATAGVFVALHLAAAWAPWWVFYVYPVNVLEAEVPLYLAGWFLLRRAWRDERVSAR